MNKPLSAAFLVAGIVLLVHGFNSFGPVVSPVSEAATGTPADHSIWPIVHGVVGPIAGGFGLLRGTK